MKTLKSKFSSMRKITAVFLAVALMAAVCCIAPVSASALENLPLVLQGGPDYVFNGNQWDPQLTIGTADLTVGQQVESIQFDLKFEDYTNVKGCFSAGSRMTYGGGEFAYDLNRDLGIYFNGVNTAGIGVTQNELFNNAFAANETALAAGETVRVTLPIIGIFPDGAVISGINIMVAHDAAASALDGVAISISNVEFTQKDKDPEAESGGIFIGDVNHKLSGNNWGPQLTISTNGEIEVGPEITAMKFDFKLPDYAEIKPNLADGSISTVGGGSWSYGPNDLGMFFGGTNCAGVGITQYNLRKAFEENEEALVAGEIVTLTLPISGRFPEGSSVNGMNVMLTFKELANVLQDKDIYIANAEFLYDTILLNDGPDYAFSPEPWEPQLIINTKDFMVSSEYTAMAFDLKFEDIASVRSYMKPGSKGTLDGSEMAYNGDIALGIYFEGTNVARKGVTQTDLFSAFDINAAALSAGETVRVVVPVSGGFTDDGIINQIKMMVTYDPNHTYFDNVPISISNVSFLRNRIVLKSGAEQKFTANPWDPQLSVATNNYNVASNITEIKFDISIEDFAALRANMSAGSKGSIGDQGMTYNGEVDLGIYFGGTDVAGVGVTQSDLFAAFDANTEALSAGETVTLTLPVKGLFKNTGVINSLNIMVAHDTGAAVFADKAVTLDNIEFIYKPIAAADVNCDNEVNAQDIVIVKKVLFGTAVDIVNENQGDINGDGYIDILDYIAVKTAALNV